MEKKNEYKPFVFSGVGKGIMKMEGDFVLDSVKIRGKEILKKQKESDFIIHKIEVCVHPSGEIKPVPPIRKRIDAYLPTWSYLSPFYSFEFGRSWGKGKYTFPEPKVINLKKKSL